MRNYNPDECQKILKMFFQENMENPTYRNFVAQARKNNWPGYVHMFHAHNCTKWSELQNIYGIKNTVICTTGHLTLDELLCQFKNEFLRISPKTIEEFNSKTNYCKVNSYARRFGCSYSNIVKKIGENSITHNHYSDEDLKTMYFKIWEKIGKQPTTTELKNNGFPRSVSNGKINEFTNKIGVGEKNKTPSVVMESDEELIDAYVNFSKKIGADNGATGFDLDHSDEIYGVGVFANRFGGLNDLRMICGYKPISHGKKKEYTKNKIAKMLIYEYEKEKRTLTKKEMTRVETLPSITTIFRYFNTTKTSEVWEKVLQQSC